MITAGDTKVCEDAGPYVYAGVIDEVTRTTALYIYEQSSNFLRLPLITSTLYQRKTSSGICGEKGMKQDKRCLDYAEAIKENEQALRELERHQRYGLLRGMRFPRLLKSGDCASQAKARNAIGLKVRAAEKLGAKYIREGLTGLLAYPYKGSKESSAKSNSNNSTTNAGKIKPNPCSRRVPMSKRSSASTTLAPDLSFSSLSYSLCENVASGFSF